MSAFPHARTLSGAWLLALAAAWAPPAAAINHGDAVSTPRAVVKVSAKLANGNNATCTGTLVAPNWVLTANHCVTGRTLPCIVGAFVEEIEVDPDCIGSNPAAGCFKVTFPGDGSADPDGDGTHTRRVVEVVPLAESSDPVDMCSMDAVEHDVALLRLASATDPAIEPIHPPILDGNTCDDTSSFTGHILGYGPDAFPFESVGETARRMQEDEWSRRDDLPEASVYQRRWELIPAHLAPFAALGMTPAGLLADGYAYASLAAYTGMQGGDSGGPLLATSDSWSDPSDLAICGTASRSWIEDEFIVDLLKCAPFTACDMLEIANHYTALDNPDVQDFLEDTLVVDGAFDCESGPDSDGDGAVDDCDACPAGNDFLDSDDDGVGDGCDICPGFDDKDDDDEDGKPAGCDICPGEGNVDGEDTSGGDVDLDGVCNSKDNCVNASNPYQGNRNAAWETIEDLEAWGDACDPIPTTAISTQGPVILEESQPVLGQTAWVDNVLILAPKVSHAAPDTSGDPDATLVVSKVSTHLRFCPDDGTVDCLAAENLDEDSQSPWADPSAEVPSSAWHPIQLTNRALGEALVLNHDDQSQQVETWDYLSDFLRWTSLGILEFPDSPYTIGTKASELEGFLWVHGVTDVGANKGTTGKHGAGASSSMMEIDPEYVTFHGPEVPELGLPWYLDLYWLGDPPADLDPIGGLLGRQFGRDVVVATRTGVGLLHDGGYAQAIDDLLGAGLSASFASGYVWSGAAEAPLDGQPLGVALAADGTGLREALWREGDKLLGVEDAGGTVALADASGPGEDSDFQVIYAPRLRSVYRVGGASGELWRGDLSYGQWVRLATDVGDVLASTAVVGDGAVYVLRAGREGTELVAFDAMTGAERSVASWSAPVREGSQLALTPDGRGGLLLSGSSAYGYWWVLQVDPTTAAPPTLLDGDAGSLRGAPLVGERGTVAYVVDREGTTGVELDLDGGEPLRTWDELAELF